MTNLIHTDKETVSQILYGQLDMNKLNTAKLDFKNFSQQQEMNKYTLTT